MKVEQTVSKDAINTTPVKRCPILQEQTTPPNKCESTIVEWDDYFMFLALLSAKRSKDPVTQVGACIVDNENRIVAIGYNGLPRNCHDDKFPWGKSKEQINDKKLYVVHAEANAILNKNSASVTGTRLYTTLFPCNECSKLIIQSGIKKIVYLSDKYDHKPKYQASKRMFDATGITYTRLEPRRLNLKLSFVKIIEADPSSPFKKLKLDSVQSHSPSSPVNETTLLNEMNGNSETITTVPSMGLKRKCYVQWDDYFMAIALLSAHRSKGPVSQVGACIVDNEQRIVAIGYNGLPRHCNDNEFPLEKFYIVHAEANAILNKNSASVSGMRLYTTHFPCNECTKLIIQSGIGKIYYLSDKYENNAQYKAAKRMMEVADISYQRFKPASGSIDLDFEEIIRDDPSTPVKRKLKEKNLNTDDLHSVSSSY